MKDAGEFRSPRRRPWLILIVLAAVGGILWMRMKPPARERPAPSQAAPPTTNAPAAARAPSVAPAPAAAVAVRPVPTTPAPAAPAVPTKPLAPEVVRSGLARARASEAREDLVAARREYLGLLQGGLDGRTRNEVEQCLGKLNVTLAFTSRPMPEKVEWVVKKGDSLDRVAARTRSTVDLIQRSNGVKDARSIRVGQRLLILSGDFAIHVSKSRNDLSVTLNGSFFKRYVVATGKEGRTPVGSFKIVDKIKEPDWWRPDGKRVSYGNPENILGTRWMSIKQPDGGGPRGYGIHGTWDNSSIGRAESAGCIRMRNEDVEELFTLAPLGTPVTIAE